MSSPTPAPPIPSTSDLAALDPAVAITLLVVVGLAIIGFYLGPLLRRPRPPDPAPAEPAPATSPARAAAAATGAQQFIDHLLEQVDDAAARITELQRETRAQAREFERRLAAKDRQIEGLQEQLQRMETLLWQQEQRRLQ